MNEVDLIRSEQITSLNDQYRKARQGFMVTRGVSALPDITKVIDMDSDFRFVLFHKLKRVWLTKLLP